MKKPNLRQDRSSSLALTLASTLALTAAAGSAHAADAGFYAGVSIGRSAVKIDDFGVKASDTAFKLFGGYRFNDYFATELAFIDGGTPSDTPRTSRYEAEISGFNASAMGRFPITESFAVFGKLGFASYDYSLRRISSGGVVTNIEDDSRSDLSYGIGASFTFNSSFSLRAEYEVVDVSDADFALVSVGGTYSFR